MIWFILTQLVTWEIRTEMTHKIRATILYPQYREIGVNLRRLKALGQTNSKFSRQIIVNQSWSGGPQKRADSYFPPEDQVRLVRLVSHGEHLYHYVSYFFLMLVIFSIYRIHQQDLKSVINVSKLSPTTMSSQFWMNHPKEIWWCWWLVSDVGDFFECW